MDSFDTSLLFGGFITFLIFLIIGWICHAIDKTSKKEEDERKKELIKEAIAESKKDD